MSVDVQPESANRWDVLARAAARREAEEDAAVLVELLAFDLDGDPYAIPVERVREIVRLRPVTAVPRVPAEVMGVISLRGEIVQVVDLRRRLGLAPAEATRRSRIIVLHADDTEVSAIRVDAVTDVLRVPESGVLPPPTTDSEFVDGLCECAGRFVSLMNLERVLSLGRS